MLLVVTLFYFLLMLPGRHAEEDSGPQVPIASSCNFDGELLCGFVQQPVGDDFDWEVGSDPVEPLGLSGDHTGGGNYFYFNTTGKATSQTAILRTMQLGSLTPHCMTFYFYMAGTDVGSLVVLQNVVGEQRRTELWSVEGDRGQVWKRAKVDVTPPLIGSTPMGFRINFDAVVGSGHLGLIAIDDVVFINGPCDSDGCDVPLGMESGWIADDQITASSAVVDFPSSAARLHGNGCWTPAISQSSWLQVEFTNTMILTGIRTQGFRTGWITKYKLQYSEALHSAWITYKEFITTDKLTGNVDADSVVEHLFTGRIQAQRIKITPLQSHMQPSLRLELIGCDYGSCTFDASPCGYTKNSSIADFVWSWKTPTGLEVWGPSSDHTAAAGGSFLLADATGRHVNDTAILSTEVLPATPAKCYEFYYHMDSPEIGALNVYLKRADMPLEEAVAMTPAWRLVGQQFGGWRRGGIEITVDFPYEVVFRAVIGEGLIFGYGDIGLDDVLVREGLCPWPEFDDCLSSPCLNNGTCTDMKDNYTCACGEQFYGLNCEHDIDDCKSAPCLNDGTCIDGDRNYTCICTNAFYGVDCQFDVQCRNLTAPDNGHLSHEGPNYYQDEVTFNCSQGYELGGASSVTCQADKTWSDPVPTCILSACVHGETLTLTNSVTEGNIKSPNYPESYPNNSDCSWTITAPSTSRIQLDFVETFNIEPGPNCPYDYVQVLEGPISDSSFLGVFCGNTLPGHPTVRTVGNIMAVQFRSDYSVPRAGFKAKYSIVTDCLLDENLVLTNSVTEGYIKSPNYPDNYPDNVRCSWTITAPSTEVIQLDFLEPFDIEDGDNCPYDAVQVFEGQISSSSVLGRFCGTSPPPTVRTVGNVMTVQLHTDHSEQRAGFMAKHSIAIPCSPTPTAPVNGTLSPEGANYYQGDVITFTCNQGYELVGEPNVTCQADLTWSDPFPTCTLSACLHGENLALTNSVTDGYIMSPNYPGDYPNSADCYWTVTAPAASVIQLDFEGTFEIEYYDHRCLYDFVKVFDGQFSTSPVLGTFCGTSPPPTVRTVGNVMTVQFHTDGSVQHAGFKARYSIALKCTTPMAPINGALNHTGPNHYQDDVMTFTCNPGYELYGAASVTCQADQTWSGPVPICTPVRCQVLTAPANGALSPPWAISYQDVVTFTCTQGYELTGASNVTCQADQQWSAPVPTCTPLLCQPLTAPANGALSPAWAISYQDVIQFFCNPGYELTGAPNLTCQADQTWSGPVPTCTPVMCQPLMAPANGGMSPAWAISYQDVIHFTCNQGYELNGASSVTCQADQQWSAPVPTCTPVMCQPLTDPANGALSPAWAISYQDVIQFTCNPGYELTGAPNLTCQADQTWSGPVPICTPILCQPLTAPANGALSPAWAISYQDVIQFTCNPGYELDGASNLTCQADQTWSEAVPTCTQIVTTTEFVSTTLPETTIVVPTSAPTTTLPETTMPETTLPETTLPETTLPETTVVTTTTALKTTVPETTLPETTLPETTVPETTVVTTTTEPPTTMLETPLPETTLPDTTLPDKTLPDTTLPDTTLPDTTLSDTTLPDTTRPDTTLPDTTLPDTTLLDTTLPDTTLLDTTLPDTTLPDTTLPDITLPDTTLPDTTVPDTTLTDTTLPDTTVMTTTTEPPTMMLETTLAETTLAETTLPETTLPETSLPGTTLPETTLPETTLPETTLPETTLPETTIMPATTEPTTSMLETTLPGTTTVVTTTTEPTTSALAATVPETTIMTTAAPKTTMLETTLPYTTEMTTTTVTTTTVPETTFMILTTNVISTGPETTPMTTTGALVTTESVVTTTEFTPPETTDTVVTTEFAQTEPETTPQETTDMIPTTEPITAVHETTTDMISTSEIFSTMPETTSTESSDMKPTEQHPTTKWLAVSKPATGAAPTTTGKPVITSTTKPNEKPVTTSTTKPTPKPGPTTAPPKEDEVGGESSSQVVIIAGAAGGGAAAVAGACAVVIIMRRRKQPAASQKLEVLDLMDLNNVKE